MSTLWNGKRGALSLTFDDALKCQYEYAVPALNKQGLRATFFAIINSKEYPLDVHAYRKVLADGHEIGSHSYSHKKAAQLSPVDCDFEARESKRVLENHFGNKVVSYCYPYTDAPARLQEAVSKYGYTCARGGRVARKDKYIRPGDSANMFNLPCFHVNEGCFTHGDVNAWVDAALERQAWLSLMFHGVGPDDNQWDNVHADTFQAFCAFLKDREAKGLWIAPFGEVAENLRANGGVI